MATVFLWFTIWWSTSGFAASLTDAEIARFNTLRYPDLKEQNTGLKTIMNLTDNKDGTLTIRTNGIPNHKTGKFPDSSTNPNEIKEIQTTLKIDKNPKLRADGKAIKCLPLGIMGVSLSGEQINSWFAAEKGCPTAEEFEELDVCEGHPSPDGSYHYHHFTPCVNKQTCGTPSEIMGVAIDGIPIYGPWDEDGKQITHQDLDECNGRVDKTGRYKYHLTVDPPYFLGCIKGEIRKDSGLSSDQFFCSCPYVDSFFERPPRPDDANGGLPPPRPPITDSTKRPDANAPRVCTFNGTGTYADCKDAYNTSYVITKKWEVQNKTVKLAPCCTAGKECPDSCIELVNGTKVLHQNCERETREIQFISRRDKTSAEIKEETDRIRNGTTSIKTNIIAIFMTIVVQWMYRFV